MDAAACSVDDPAGLLTNLCAGNTPACDALDNDGDGVADDISEKNGVRAYTIKFDLDGNLTSGVVNIHARMDDNAQAFAALGNQTYFNIYKVSGDVFDPSVDGTPVFSSDIVTLPQLGTEYNSFWDFRKNASSPGDPIEYVTGEDGLYCCIFTCIDAADNERSSVPSYFIIDTRAPAQVGVLQNWQDDNGNENLINLNSTTLGFIYRPVAPITTTDSKLLIWKFFFTKRTQTAATLVHLPTFFHQQSSMQTM